ncbi:MAG: hypothetical protein JO056_05955 [Alphaproteobacteria bacterium]|nr:hypothetical protein [Alphaproteobacteria bacterium]
MLKKRKRSLPLLIVNVVVTVLCCGLFSASLFAANYVSIDIPGATDVHPVAVNRKAQVAGFFYRNGFMESFLRQSDGTVEILHSPEGSNSFMFDMNEAGEIVGGYPPGNPVHAFLRSPDGKISKIDPPGTTFATAVSINADGAAVGTSSVGFYIRARNGRYTTFSAGWPCGINDSGIVAGNTRDDLGYLRAPDGAVTLFDPALPGFVLAPNCIDNRGDVVGWYQGADGNTRSFIRRIDGSVMLIDVPGMPSTMVESINAHGIAIGTYWDRTVRNSFLYKPDGSFRLLTTPFGDESMAFGLAGRHYLVGSYYLPADQTRHGYLRIR